VTVSCDENIIPPLFSLFVCGRSGFFFFKLTFLSRAATDQLPKTHESKSVRVT